MHFRETGLCDLADDGFNVIRYEFHFDTILRRIPDDILCVIVSVSGLTDAADIYDILICRVKVCYAPVQGGMEDGLSVIADRLKGMRVPDETEFFFHIFKNIL